MLDEAPHILRKKIIINPDNDELGRPIPGTGKEDWIDVAECFCHDNSQMEKISVNGRMIDFSFHVVYDGEVILPDTDVECIDKISTRIVGCGKVIKKATCYSDEFKDRQDIWL